jgi:drug/metabolite transporter (DMT)-like permease
MSSASPSRNWVGIGLALAAAVAFAFANAAASLAYHGGSNPPTVSAFRFVLPTAALIVWLRAQGVPLALPARDGWVAVALGAVTAAYSWALLSAIGAIPIALAILIFYLFPLVATVILAACGWERFGWRTTAAIVLAFIGLAMALDPVGGGPSIEGVMLALFAAVGLGAVVALSSRLFRAGDSRPVTLYMAGVASVLLIAFCTVQGQVALPQTSLGWSGFLGTTAFYAFAMIAFFIAISMIGPVRTSLLSYAEPVVTAALGVIVLDESLTPVQVAGIALVVAALVGSTLRPLIR